MASLDFVIPPILTNASWQKNKGVVAKILVGKTDVGASLIALEKEVASSGFGKVKPFAGKDLVEFEAYRAKTVDELKKAVGKIEGKVQAADVTATAAYGKATDSRLVPKAVAAHIDAIIDELVKFKLVVRTYPDKVATELAALFRKSLATNAAAVSILSIANGAVGKNYTRFMNDLKSVHKKPSLTTTALGVYAPITRFGRTFRLRCRPRPSKSSTATRWRALPARKCGTWPI